MKARSLLVILALFLAAGSLYAQGGATGTILGTVTDNSGAVVPNANVDVTNVDTNVISHAKTSGTGNYTVPYLNPGHYQVTVEASGFEKAVVANVTLVVDQQVRVDTVLKPGTVTQSVEVQANPVALDTDNAAISQLISNRQVTEIPLNGRNFQQLLLLSPGAVAWATDASASWRPDSIGGLSINGSRPESSNYTLDGMSELNTLWANPAIFLSVDAIQEFKLQADNYSAEFGFSANQVNIIGKSGTNSLHGTLFEFDRNNFFDARNPLVASVPVLRQNQFGFVVDGPVVLPHIYDGHNKTFFMANYEGLRVLNPYSLIGTVESPAELGGDFSASGLPSPGTPQCAAALVSNLPCMPVNPATGAPFQGNRIPTTMFSRLATVALANGLFPAPNCNPASPGCQGGNLAEVGSLPQTGNQQTYRLDQDLGRYGKLFGRGTYAAFSHESPGSSLAFPMTLLTSADDERQWAVSHTISINANTVNNFRLGYLHSLVQVGVYGNAVPPQAAVNNLGIAGIFKKYGPGQLGWPDFQMTGYSSMGGPVNNYTDAEQPMWEFADSLTTVRGKHTLSFGGDYRHWQAQFGNGDDFLGDYSYQNDTILTNGVGCATVVCGTGNAVSDFLLGYYNSAENYAVGPFSNSTLAGNPTFFVYNYMGAYAQDDWKASTRLTVNVGLRWDLRTVPYDTQNKFFWLDVNNPNGGLCYANPVLQTDGVAPPGNGVYEYCGRRSPKMPGEYTPFGPRIGLAYRPFGEKTVIRGGYGIYYDSSESREIDSSGNLYPYIIRTSLSPTTQAVTTAPKLTDQLFPNYGTLGPVDPSSLTFLAVIESERPVDPYAQEWSLSVQRQLDKNTTLEFSYIGSKGTHLLDRHDIAQPYAPSNPAVCQANPADCPVSARLPLPNFSGFYIDSDWSGYSNYNAGNIKLERRSGQMAVTALFTWSKSMDDKSAAANSGSDNPGYQGFMNNHDVALDYGPSDFNVDHRFVFSYVYNLPFGRGKHFLSSVSKAADAALGGWELSGITTFQSGFPTSIGGTDVDGILGTFGQRVDQVAPLYPSGFKRSTNEWFNTAAFVNPPIAEYGTTSRNFMREPGINNWDIALFKNFAFTERTNLQLRLETFNSFNHPQYTTPPTAAGTCNPDCNLPDATFGHILYSAPGRIVQLGGKFIF